MEMDLRLLRSFVTMAEEGNVGRAAQRLYISQPALSKQLQRLEAFLGVELFHRHHRMLSLTPAGMSFFDDAQKLLAQAADITVSARNTARADASQVTVAFVAGLVGIATALLRASQRQQPGLGVRRLRVEWIDQTDCLRNGRADVALMRLPIDERDLERQVLISEPRVAGLASTHPLAARTWHPRFGYGRAWRVPGVTDPPTAGSGRDTRTSTRMLAVGNLISQAIRRTPRL